MKWIFSLLLMVSVSSSLAENSWSEYVLENKIIELLALDVETSDAFEVLDGYLWNEERSALVVSKFNGESTTLYIFIKQQDGSFKGFDVSAQEQSNLGRIGLWKEGLYSRVESVPIDWKQWREGYYHCDIRTRAWKEGPCYTVSGLLAVTEGGKYIVQ